MIRRRVLTGLSVTALGLGMAVAAPGGPAQADGAKSSTTVFMHDDCDPTTFNAALGDPHACVGDGTTTFDAFIGEISSTGRAKAWHFNPGRTSVHRGDLLVAKDTGGEAHSFTRVANFGGGCVQALNDILHLTPVPECSQTLVVNGQRVPKFVASLVAPGASRTVTAGVSGTLKYECLIHPWMRLTVQVSD